MLHARSAFYLNYGFQKTSEFKKGQRGNHFLFVYPVSSGGQPQGGGFNSAGGGRSKRKVKRARGGVSGKEGQRSK